MTRKFLLTLVIAGLPFVTGLAFAQEETAINAQRPGFSASPISLAPGLWQIEGGYQYTGGLSGVDADNQTLPLALLRYGLADRVELQFGWAGYSRVDAGSQDVDGANDASIAVNWQLTAADSAVPLSIIALLSLPVGDEEFSSDEVDPAVGLAWSHSAGLDWFGTLSVSFYDDDSSVGNAFGVSLPVNERTSGYVEYYGNYGSDSGTEHYINGGIAYLPELNMQLDVNGGFGLNDNAADFFVGFGIAYRF